MVLDITVIRQTPEVVFASEKNRCKDISLLEKVIQLDEIWRKERFNGDTLNRIKNQCSKVISKKMKSKDITNESNASIEFTDIFSLNEANLMAMSVNQIKALSKNLDEKIESNNVSLTKIEMERNQNLNEVGNILHPNVVISDDEDFNGLIRIYGDTTIKKTFSHVDLVDMIGGVDFKMGAKNSGSRCYYLGGPCFYLEQALITFSSMMMYNKSYKAVSPPVFMNKDAMQQVAQLMQFDSELYKVVCKRSEDPSVDEGEEERYLIATSEQAIAALYRDSWIPKGDLPIRIMGVSDCFRQEVGSHGRDTRGIFRVHQFKKVEQFCITSPHDGESDQMFEEMIGNAESFYKELGIPYRIVSIVSGALNNAAAIKYDLEGWFPGSGCFRELVSCSNCTDYQARSVLARYGETKPMNQTMEYVHMLNCTLCATTRVICAILENYQTVDGIVVPKALRPYMPNGLHEFIPFAKLTNKK